MSATASFWPYAMLMANDTLNQTPNMSDECKRSPLQTFSSSEVQTNPKHWVPFGCPAYVLVGELQNQKRIYNKWNTYKKKDLPWKITQLRKKHRLDPKPGHRFGIATISCKNGSDLSVD